MEPQPRTVALCVSQWNHPTTFYAWTWLKQYFLRRSPAGAEEELHSSDKLIIVRVGKNLDDGKKWKVGGPLIADVDTALQNYHHEIIKLQGSIQSQMRSFTEQHNIDIVVLGDEFPQSGFKLTSVTDWVKEKVACPFIIIRPEAVRNVRMRIGSNNEMANATGAGGKVEEGEGRIPSLSPPHAGRKICIAYEQFGVGQHLMEKAKQVVLEPEDTVYVAHCFPTQGIPAQQWLHPQHVMKQAGKLAKVMTFQRGSSRDMNVAVTPDNSIDFGAKELEDYKVMLNVILKGDPRSALEKFCEQEGIDLLVIGTRASGRLRKTLTGGSVSGYLIDHAPCPCLVIPYKSMGISAETSYSGEEEGGGSPRAMSSSPFGFMSGVFSGVPGVDAAIQTESTVSPPQAASVSEHLEVGTSAAAAATAGEGSHVHSTPSDMLSVLRQQLEEKDRLIAELRAQVQQMRLAQAQNRDTQTHDPMLSPTSY